MLTYEEQSQNQVFQIEILTLTWKYAHLEYLCKTYVLKFAEKGSPTQIHRPAYIFRAKHMHTYQWDQDFNPSS